VENREKWPDWLNLALGLWLFVAGLFPAAQIMDAGAWNHYIAGLAIAIVAGVAISRPQKWEEWTNLILGLWVFLAPFLLGFWEVGWSLWNHLIIGMVVAGLALWTLVQRQRMERVTV
jgi:hypothetical protein